MDEKNLFFSELFQLLFVFIASMRPYSSNDDMLFIDLGVCGKHRPRHYRFAPSQLPSLCAVYPISAYSLARTRIYESGNLRLWR